MYRWRQARETASFLFGFVAGNFAEATSRRGNVSLRYLGSSFSSGELHRVFRDTPDMFAFFEERAGLPYPGDSYTQALVATSGGQELAGLSHMSEGPDARCSTTRRPPGSWRTSWRINGGAIS